MANDLILNNGGIQFADGSVQSAAMNRNKIINGNFSINQRAVSGTVTLAAGIYGHDRFKAGAGGCTYTFSTLYNVTTLNITAGTLMQVIEGSNLFSGTHVLSWTGSAQGRIDSGSYGNSGITGTAVGGTNQTVEFGTGTLSLVQYEQGTLKSNFEYRPIGTELALCQRYYEYTIPYSVSALQFPKSASAYAYYTLPWRVVKRAVPIVTIADYSNNTAKYSTYSANGTRTDNRTPIGAAGDLYAFQFVGSNADTDTAVLIGYISASAEL